MRKTMAMEMVKKAAVLMAVGLLSVKALPVQATELDGGVKEERTLFAEVEAGAVLEGTLGETGGLKWSYENATETLTVSGEDRLWHYNYYTEPSPFQVQENIIIKKIVFKDCKIIEGGGIFAKMEQLQEIDFSGLDTSEMDNMSGMFFDCRSLTSLDLSGFDTSAVTDMSSMFVECRSLKSVDISHFDTSAVTNMSSMFINCNLTSLDVSHFDTRAVTNMDSMFHGCSSLTSLDVSRFDTRAVTNMNYMFSDCNNLKSLDLSGFDVSAVTDMDRMFLNCSGLSSLKTPKKMGELSTDLPYRMFDAEGYAYEVMSSQNSDKILTAKAPDGVDLRGTFGKNGNLQWSYENATGTLMVSGEDELKISEWVSPLQIEKTVAIKKIVFKECKIIGKAEYLFYAMESLKEIDFSGLDTSAMTSMKDMFDRCSSLTSLDLSNFDTSVVTDMSGMFYGCSNLSFLKTPKKMGEISADLPYKMFEEEGYVYEVMSSQNSGKILTTIPDGVDLRGILGKNGNLQWSYENATGTLTVSGEDELKESEWVSPLQIGNTVVIKKIVFKECKIIGKAECLFYQMESLEEIDFSGLDTSAVTSMGGMFYGCDSLTSLDLSSFDTSAVTDMDCMFEGCSSLTSLDLSSFNTSAVTDMGRMFYGCRSLKNLDLSKFDTSEVTNMAMMFVNCDSLISLDLSSFDTSKVTNMEWMFYGCDSLAGLDLSSFNTSAVTTMKNMFWFCGSLTSLDVSSFNTSAVTNMEDMFGYCSGLTSLDVSGFDTSAVTDMGRMFERCSGLTSLDLNSFNTSAVTDMRWMFRDCSGLTSLDVGSFDTSAVTSMELMFDDCDSLTSLDLSSFDTSAVTDMDCMFGGCSGLTSLDVSHFDTSAVTTMLEMFCGCSGLTSLDVSHFDTKAVKVMEDMFGGCSGLTSLDLSSFDTSAVKRMSKMFSCCRGLTSLDLSSFDTSAVTNMSEMFLDCPNLISLKTPKKMGKKSVNLPGVMKDKKGNTYKKMSSENVGKTLTREVHTTHTYDEGKVTKKATCTEEGIRTYTCTICKEKKTEPIAKTAHSYKDKVKKATLTKDGSITPTCSVCGATKKATVISRPKTIKLSADSFSYNGKAKKPTVTIKDAKGKVIKDSNYKVTYGSGRVKVGSYKVTVAFKGNYSGTKNLTFTINPAPVKIKTLTPGSQKLTVKWEKNTKEVKGYELQYSTNKKFPEASTKTITIKKNSTTSNTISKLKAKTKYFVRIRTYQTVSKKTYYSEWSNTLNATTKK